MKFNTSQAQAVAHTDGPALVLAGPGSGKTTVIIHRILNLIEHEGIDGRHILAVTFSRASANEMRERFLAACADADTERTIVNALQSNNQPAGNEASRKPHPAPGQKQDLHMPVFGTFHSIFLRILTCDRANSGLRLIDERRRHSIIRSEIERFAIRTDDIAELVSLILLAISNRKCGQSIADVTGGLVKAETLHRIYDDYEARKKAAGLIDFDDIILLCHSYLQANPGILGEWQDRFRYICIDEFQDISPAQYSVLTLLAGERANVFAVGDDDQSIYGFRGASPRLMKKFISDYPQSVTIHLDVNYRSSPSIVAASRVVISENTDRFPKDISSGVSFSEPEPLIIRHFPTRHAQTSWIISQLRALSGSAAILTRNNSGASLIVKMLDINNIPYVLHCSVPDFMKHFIPADICAYIRAALIVRSGGGTGLRKHLLKILNKPSRFILRDSLSGEGNDCFLSMNSYYQQSPNVLHNISLLHSQLSFLSSLPPYAAVQYILKVIGYEKWLQETAGIQKIDFEKYSEIVELFTAFASEFRTLGELIKAVDAPPINGGTGGTTTDSDTSRSNITECAVHIMTMHSSKGLEFDTVFLPDMNDRIFPGPRAVKDGNVEEERRLMYVGMTRARKRLRITFAGNPDDKKAAPSRFLNNLI